jgi:hypothetical protein
MKNSILLSANLVCALLFVNQQVTAQANTSLSNLVSPTSVNQNLLPSSDNTKDLGSTSSSWKDGYFDGSAYVLTTLFAGGSSGINGIQINPNSTGKTTDLRFMEVATNGTNYIGFRAPTSISANKVWVLPGADGTNGQVLSTNGSGTLSWITPAGGGGVGTNTTHYIPKWDGAALVTGTLKDTLNRITNGNYSIKGRLTMYRNTGILSSDGESAVQGIGNSSVSGTTFSRGYLGATALNELVDQEFFAPFSSTLDHAGVLGFANNSVTTDGAGVVGLSQVAGLSYGLYGISNGSGAVKYGSYGKAAASGGPFGINTGSYGEGTGAVANFGVWGHVNASNTDALNSYAIYGSTSGSNGSVYAGYFAGDVIVTDEFTVEDSMHVFDAMTVGTANRPNAYEFAVTGGYDGYFDDKLSVQTTTASASLNVKGTNETILMEGSTPYMKLVDGVNQPAFIQASGNDLRLGTLSGNNSGKLIFRFNGVNKNAMDVNGKLGLGTTTPSSLLHLKGSNELLRIEGTDAYIGFYSGSTQKAFIWRTGDNLKLASNSGSVILGNNVTGDHVFILSDGRVGIGTSTPKSGYKLSVEGKVACRELKVETAAWPDYVFSEEFQLMPLSEVENFITKNNHLPGIPSAAAVVGEGLDVGAMQVKMMEKIEELTLYVIDLQKQNDALKEKVTLLENR